MERLRRLAVGALLLFGLAAIDAPARAERGASGSSRPEASRWTIALRVTRAEFGSGWLGRCMFTIAGRETGWTFDPRATNWSDVHSDGSRGSFGLWQIGAVHRRAGETVTRFRFRMYRPRANARQAHVLYRAASLAPWGGSC